MKKYNMPYRLTDIGVDKTEEAFELYYDKICASNAIESEEDSRRLVKSLRYLWDIE